jgi:hypothetical protein
MKVRVAGCGGRKTPPPEIAKTNIQSAWLAAHEQHQRLITSLICENAVLAAMLELILAEWHEHKCISALTYQQAWGMINKTKEGE